MGEAKRRGTREQRVEQGVVKRAEMERQRQERIQEARDRAATRAAERDRERSKREVVLVNDVRPRRVLAGHGPRISPAVLAAVIAMAAANPAAATPEEP